jgi:hypothetical protein
MTVRIRRRARRRGRRVRWTWPFAWMVIGVFAASVLTLTWLGVILTPSERSQPDMRAATATAKTGSDRAT